MPRLAARLALAAIAAAPCAQDLVPAGTINAAVDKQNAVFVVQDEPAIVTHAEGVRSRLFGRCRMLRDVEARDGELAGCNLMVYGTPAHAWLKQHAARLPFTFGEKHVTIEGRRFEGEHLRVICAVKNPADANKRALLYVAAHAADVRDINNVFHGPTEWVVADGARTLAAGNFAGAPLAVDALRADLDALVQQIGEVHPATLKGLPPELEKAVAAARASLTAPMTRAAAWRVFARVIGVLRDAHSAFAAPASGERLDLPLVWHESGLVLAEDAGELRRGDRIVTVAGRTPQQLEAALQDVVPAENAHWLRARGEALVADLGILRALGIAAAAPVLVRVERDGKESDVAVGLAPPRGRGAAAQPWVRFTLEPEHGLALFTLDQCVVDDTYKTTLEKFFRAVHEQKLPRVAVDLRRNGGGNSGVTDEFLRYVDVEQYLSFGSLVRGSSAVRAQRGQLAKGSITNPQPRARNPVHEDPPPFRGELLVLAGNHTFSSGTWFATVVQDNGLGRVVGEPTGGQPSSFGDILSFTLPNSGLSYTLSFKQWLRPKPERDPADTLAPDVAVPRTRGDVAAGRDPVLEWLRQKR